ncbi:Pre-rRNA-processing protein esf1 [Taphrina deformans PYCC 5710]|uniref:Pre-rRNA-processing protein esf1 n=1 Tax=Taphrina deformans (strain PYCC 5710 / ATCC 11124 / CBS 356.35 / IMI 108563 / JCM 9778 / NBRC 8474) TaxID=1097556 RepID=R4XD16_TAPDE|nr:Pre-rRNA-processing protein esf1 [Taphrina deformans PYCC 5710]|eukprot:CCG81215.1 Pre-rRNA-processing protein esf1 [Taphrina deformans PYCC 5710]
MAPKDSSGKVSDPRFASVHNDPRFVRPKKRDRKVGIDKRFSQMLSDKDFSTNAKVDRYGRKLDGKKASKELENLYELEKSDEESAVKPTATEFTAFDDEDAAQDVDLDENESDEDSSEVESVKFDPARGEGNISSSDDEDDLPEDAPIDGRDLIDPEPDRENIPQGEVTSRFAVVNLDWDNLHAEDLFVTMNSFKSALGSVQKVSIFPSEFGKERMAKEDTAGPPQNIFGVDGEDDDRPINAKTIVKESLGEEFDMAKLRQYQLDRLRYYYAIVECDSPATAKHIYDNCDGAEFEASANFFDLRFVPDGEDFTDEPRETCTSLPELYEPNEFVTDALQHSKVKLTWDNDDPKKAQFAKKAFSKAEMDDMELKAYLASSDSEDGEDATALKSKWKALLKAGEDSDEEEKPSGDMEITFSAGLSTNQKDNDEVDPENETTIEKYKRKDAEKKQRRRENKGLAAGTEEKVDLGFDDPFFSEAPSKSKKKEAKPTVDREKEAKEKAELDLLVMDDKDTDGRDHFDLKNILRSEKQAGKKRHRRSKKEEPREGLQDDFDIDVKDPRFAAAFDNENHHFALDPTSSQFKKTKAMSKILEARRNKSNKSDTAIELKSGRDRQKKRKADGVDDLVRSVKAKSGRA